MRKNVKVEKQKSFSFSVKESGILMKTLISGIPDKSRNTIKSLLAHGQISINNQIVTKFNYPLQPGDAVSVRFSKTEGSIRYSGLKILFEDNDIIVIEKEAGLLSIATNKERRETAYFILTEHVRKTSRRERVFIIHRLDREASGVMMFAKSIEVQEAMQKNWMTAVDQRKYAVVVEGSLEENEGTITSWLKENTALIMYSCKYDNGGQKAITHFKVVKRNANYSLLEVILDTGRKNQIRVHMQDLKHSIVGDKKYGATHNPIKRMGLHAQTLVFNHPVSGKEMKFESPIPKSFLSLFA